MTVIDIPETADKVLGAAYDLGRRMAEDSVYNICPFNGDILKDAWLEGYASVFYEQGVAHGRRGWNISDCPYELHELFTAASSWIKGQESGRREYLLATTKKRKKIVSFVNWSKEGF